MSDEISARQRRALRAAINALNKAYDWLVKAGGHEALADALHRAIAHLEEGLKGEDQRRAVQHRTKASC